MAGLYFRGIQVQKAVLNRLPVSKVGNCCSYCLLNNGQVISIHGAECICTTNKRLVTFCLKLKNFTGVHPIVLLAFSTINKDTFDNCDVCEAVQLLAFLLSDDIMQKYKKAYTANGVSIDAQVCHETWPAIINALIHLFPT